LINFAGRSLGYLLLTGLKKGSSYMPAEATANQFSQLIPFIAIAFIFYFIVFRPEEKEKQKKKKELLEKLKKNDQVVTAGGIHGTVVNIKTTTVILRVDDNVKIEVDKEAIATTSET